MKEYSLPISDYVFKIEIAARKVSIEYVARCCYSHEGHSNVIETYISSHSMKLYFVLNAIAAHGLDGLALK